MSRTASFRNNPIPLRGRVAFWLSAAAALSLLLTVRLGTIGAAGFIGLWMLYIVAWPKFSADAMLRTVLPWMLPLFAMVSVVWSQAPDLTLRTAAEYLAMIGIAAVMVATLPVQHLLASWMLALIPVVLVGGMVGGQQFTETGEVAAIGIFGSKNNFALHISEMFFICVAVLASPRQQRWLRLIALLGIVGGPALLWRAKSIGALAVFLPSLLVLCTVIGLGHLQPRARKLAIAGLLTLGLASAAVVAPVAESAKDTLLASVGKSGDLTGRGLLWQRARILIAQRPIGGTGYAAFWVQGNPEAEALWRAEHIPGRGGFHFHNFYYEMLVELGYTGLAVGLTCYVLTGIAVCAWAARSPSPESGVFAAFMLFFCLRSFVELDLAGGFGLSSLLLPAGWLYATAAERRAATRRVAQPQALPLAAVAPYGLRGAE
jgi:exopolysaccharide production protein ExoQ